MFYLDVFNRADLRLRRAPDFLWSFSADLHQVQNPFSISVLFGPMNVKRRRNRRLPQVVYLKEVQL